MVSPMQFLHPGIGQPAGYLTAIFYTLGGVEMIASRPWRKSALL